MATKAWATPVDHTNDAGFQAWGLDLQTNLALSGLVQTSDTGQVNWATATRPGVDSTPYYSIWRFNDTLQATAPIFIRLEFGTGATTNRPRFRVQVGTGTNGAGTLTGTTSTIRSATANQLIASTVTAYSSYVTGGEGYFALVWKDRATSSGNTLGMFAISRTVSILTGEVDDEGAFIILHNAGGTVIGGPMVGQSLSFSRNIAFTQTEYFGLLYGNLANTVFDNTVQAMSLFLPLPKIRIIPNFCSIRNSEISSGNTFELALVGNTKKVFLNVGPYCGKATAATDTVTGFCIPWE